MLPQMFIPKAEGAEVWGCPVCNELFYVERRPHSEWRVSREFTPLEPMNFYECAQLQAAVGPLCMDPVCGSWLIPMAERLFEKETA